MKALIDGDSIIYKIAFALEEKIYWGVEDDEEPSYYYDIDKMYEAVDDFIYGIEKATATTGASEIYLTGSNNFRNSNPLGYKLNRADVRRPDSIPLLKHHLVAYHNAKIVDNVEADDIVVYKKNKYPSRYVLCAIDKDVLYQTEGIHYNYGSEQFVTVDKLTATRFAYIQALMGDPSDGYKGCKGIGVVKANKLLEDLKTEEEMWNKVVELYLNAGQTEEDAIHTMQLASMTQYKGNGVIELWQPSPNWLTLRENKEKEITND